MTKRIAVLAGDGIGPEVIEAALADIPRGDFEVVRIEAGAERYLRSGEVLSQEDLDTARASDAFLLGAVGDPRVADGILERGILLRLRKELDLYVNVRPFPELGITFVRENSEGAYAEIGIRDGDYAYETSVNTWAAIERCVRYAFGLAESRAERLTWVHKTNVLGFAGGLWREVVESVAADHPGVPLSYEHADAAAYHLVKDPGRFDVVVTDNLFGDVLSDLAAGLGEGLGAAASSNLHPNPSTRPTRCIGLFEPVHGSAPDIAGKGIADPTAARRAVAMMLTALSGAPDASPHEMETVL
jgi:3-isopropylmalate dehydrogenase